MTESPTVKWTATRNSNSPYKKPAMLRKGKGVRAVHQAPDPILPFKDGERGNQKATPQSRRVKGICETNYTLKN